MELCDTYIRYLQCCGSEMVRMAVHLASNGRKKRIRHFDTEISKKC